MTTIEDAKYEAIKRKNSYVLAWYPYVAFNCKAKSNSHQGESLYSSIYLNLTAGVMPDSVQGPNILYSCSPA